MRLGHRVTTFRAYINRCICYYRDGESLVSSVYTTNYFPFIFPIHDVAWGITSARVKLLLYVFVRLFPGHHDGFQLDGIGITLIGVWADRRHMPALGGAISRRSRTNGKRLPLDGYWNYLCSSSQPVFHFPSKVPHNASKPLPNTKINSTIHSFPSIATNVKCL